MKALLGFALAVSIAAPAAAVGGDTSPAAYTATGWFACDRCSRARVADGRTGPSDRACAQRCIARGEAVVFVDENAVASFRITNPESVKGQESHYVRVRGTFDPTANTLEVGSFEVLKTFVPKCGRPTTKE